MKTTLRKCFEDDLPLLVGIWEKAVRSSHDFLSDNDIAEIRSHLIPDYFPAVSLTVAEADCAPAGFIGTLGGKIEMLFIAPEHHGKGLGTALVDHARDCEGCTLVDVNEQNPSALEFYRHYGFKVYDRSATDAAGRPFPILHMKL